MSDLAEQLLERLVIVVHEEIAGLWEIIAEGRNLAPNAAESDLRKWARKAVQGAIEQGFARLVIGSLATENWSAVDTSEVIGLLDDPLNWYPPANHQAWHVRLEATSLGEEEFRRRVVKP